MTELDDTQIDYRLKNLKPLHLKFINFYSLMSTTEVKENIISGFEKSEIFDSIKEESENLPLLNPLNDLCHFGNAAITESQSVFTTSS